MSSRRPAPATILIGLAAVAAGALLGAGLTGHPLVVVILLLLAACGCYAVAFLAELPRIYLGSLGVVLLGYALFGRSFAYLGVPPVFIGEVMLGFGVVASVLSGYLLNLTRSAVAWMIVAVAACGTAATVPYLSTYRVDALRDAAMWGYGTFSFTVAACVLSTRSIPAITRHYDRGLVWFMMWPPIATVLGRAAPALLTMPGSGATLAPIKPGDVAVHLAGAAAFVLLGLGGIVDAKGRPRRRRLFWVLWCVSFLMVSALNRGGFLAVLTAFGVLSLFEPRAVGRRLAVAAAATVALAGIVVLTSFGLEDRTKLISETEQRALSPHQVVENVMSITGRKAPGDLSNTREWRLEWWTKIVDYTVFGQFFWTGKGFGVNLADDDGFQVAEGDVAPLRSPHNSMMTVLARMGVPGISLWLALQATFGGAMALGYLRARRAGELRWARLDLWLLAYWAAFLVDSCFDVFLEGPQGGIWFWCVLGLGIAVLQLQQPDVEAARLARSAS